MLNQLYYVVVYEAVSCFNGLLRKCFTLFFSFYIFIKVALALGWFVIINFTLCVPRPRPRSKLAWSNSSLLHLQSYRSKIRKRFALREKNDTKLAFNRPCRIYRSFL